MSAPIFDISSVVNFALNKFLAFWNWGFTYMGITVSIGSWFAMCLVFVLIVKVIDVLSGGNVLGAIISGIGGYFKGD